MRPARTPIGLQLTQVARSVGRAFDDVLVESGGSLPVWLVLLNLKVNPDGSQRQIAQAIGVTEATLTHHLNAMDADGLVTRERHAANRRVHRLELTESGEAAFRRLRGAAMEFDRRLRQGISAEETEVLRNVLDRLAGNVGGPIAHPGPDPLPKGRATAVGQNQKNQNQKNQNQKKEKTS